MAEVQETIGGETLEAVQARHRKELRDLQSRITSKKKNATKKTRKGINDECAELERQTRERHEQEVAVASGQATTNEEDVEENEEKEEVDEEVNGVTQNLKDAEISTPETQGQQSTSATSDGGGGAGSGGKKRNRQKERLARRAAEREAESLAAETEAASMTDHRKIERKHLDAEFKAHGLQEHEIAPDGHCLFSAVADQLARGGGGDKKKMAGGPAAFREVRKAAAAWIAEHPDDFAPFLDEPLEGYVGRIRDTAEWGGQLELLALANCYGVVIKVVQETRTETIEPTTAPVPALPRDKDEELDVIWLAYYRHGYGLGEHYNSLRKTTG